MEEILFVLTSLLPPIYILSIIRFFIIRTTTRTPVHVSLYSLFNISHVINFDTCVYFYFESLLFYFLLNYLKKKTKTHNNMYVHRVTVNFKLWITLIADAFELRWSTNILFAKLNVDNSIDIIFFTFNTSSICMIKLDTIHWQYT